MKHALPQSSTCRVKCRWLTGRRFVIAIPYLWLIGICLLPLLLVLKISLSEMDVGNPLGSLLSYQDGLLIVKIKLANYFLIAEDRLYLLTYLSSLMYAALTAVLCLVIGFPFSYFMARSKESVRSVLILLVMLPFWTSFLLRIYAWKGILSSNGLVNGALMNLGIIQAPLPMMNTAFSMLLGMVYAYLPFMILPLYANLVKMDGRLLEAAANLGATPWQTFWTVTVPLSRSAIIAGSLLVFVPCVGEYVIPELLGGPQTLMIGRVLWDEFFTNNDWPIASALTVVMFILILLPMLLLNKYQADQEGATHA